jgi:hypothetical protein
MLHAFSDPCSTGYILFLSGHVSASSAFKFHYQRF